MYRSYAAIGATAVIAVAALGFTLAPSSDAGGSALHSSTSVKGPPWISVEYPANPYDPATRGALVVLRSYHHDVQIEAAATASAISIIDGERRTIPLEITATSRSGVYAVRGKLPEDVASVLVLTTREGGSNGAPASALVAVDGDQELLAVRVPHDSREGGSWLVPREPTRQEVDALLRTAVALDGASKAVDVASADAANR